MGRVGRWSSPPNDGDADHRGAGARRRGACYARGRGCVVGVGAAVFEALEASTEWQNGSIRVLPGGTGMLAAGAGGGAPLGHDFCAINLSDNLKPWSLIEKRLGVAAEAGFAIALYNPRSASRPEGFARALEILKDAGCGERTIIFAHAVTTPRERIDILPLREATVDMADMATLVIIGNSATRRGGRWVYASRRLS